MFLGLAYRAGLEVMGQPGLVAGIGEVAEGQPLETYDMLPERLDHVA